MGTTRQSLQAQLYEPFRQLEGSPSEVGVVVRAEGVTGQAGTALFDSIRRLVQSQHSQNVVFGAQTMNEVIAASLARQRFSMILLNAFAVVALLTGNSRPLRCCFISGRPAHPRTRHSRRAGSATPGGGCVSSKSWHEDGAAWRRWAGILQPRWA